MVRGNFYFSMVFENEGFIKGNCLLIVLKLKNKVGGRVGEGWGNVLGEPKQKMYLKVEVKIWRFEGCGIYTE
jgi:hypothetical protein